jgi:hypothetical protein
MFASFSTAARGGRLSASRAISTPFLGRPRVVEPLNCESLAEKIATHFPPDTHARVRLFRGDHSRILFFREEELQRQRHRSRNLSGGLFTALPSACLQPPPLCAYPAGAMPVWNNSGAAAADMAVAAATAPTVDAYVAALTASEPQPVGMLTATPNELRFVVANTSRAVLFEVDEMRLASDDVHSSAFHFPFLSKVAACPVLERCSVIWITATGTAGEQLAQAAEQHEDESVRRALGAAPWLRMSPLRTGMSRTAWSSRDSLLRDTFYGEMKVFQ